MALENAVVAYEGLVFKPSPIFGANVLWFEGVVDMMSQP